MGAAELTGGAAAGPVARREASAAEVVAAHLARIEQVDGATGAVVASIARSPSASRLSFATDVALMLRLLSGPDGSDGGATPVALGAALSTGGATASTSSCAPCSRPPPAGTAR